jgi:hypothetical protein
MAARKNPGAFQRLTIQAAGIGELEDGDGSAADSGFLRDWVYFAERRMPADRFAKRSVNPPLAFAPLAAAVVKGADAKAPDSNVSVHVSDQEVPALRYLFASADAVNAVNGPFCFAPVALRLPEIRWMDLNVDESEEGLLGRGRLKVVRRGTWNDMAHAAAPHILYESLRDRPSSRPAYRPPPQTVLGVCTAPPVWP